MRRACLCLLLLSAAAPAAAQDSAVATRAQARALDAKTRDARARQDALAAQSEALDRQLEVTTAQMIALARAIQSHERRLTALEASLVRLASQQKRALADLDSRRAEIANLLAALQRLSRRPPVLVLARPQSAIETARAVGMMQAMVADLRERARDLRSKADELRRVRDQQVTERARYRRELTELQRSRSAIDRLREQRERSRSAVLLASDQMSARLSALARETTTLQGLLAKLEVANARSEHLASLPGHRFRPADLGRRHEQPAPRPEDSRTDTAPVIASAPRPAPAFSMPASGRIASAFGADSETGVSARGVTIITRPAAQVTAAAPGRVLFAGEFRGYGLLLIVAHSNGYHSLLAGFSRIDVSVGAPVQAGEPVGVMPEEPSPELYLEVRQNGQPVDPATWLRRSNAGAARTRSG